MESIRVDLSMDAKEYQLFMVNVYLLYYQLAKANSQQL